MQWWTPPPDSGLPCLRARAALPWRVRAWRTLVRWRTDFLRRRESRRARGVRWYEDDPLHDATIAAARARSAGAVLRRRLSTGTMSSAELLVTIDRLQRRLADLADARERVVEFGNGSDAEVIVVLEAVDLTAKDALDAVGSALRPSR